MTPDRAGVAVRSTLARISTPSLCTADTDRDFDFDADGTVGILDLLTLLANWGPCA